MLIYNFLRKKVLFSYKFSHFANPLLCCVNRHKVNYPKYTTKYFYKVNPNQFQTFRFDKSTFKKRYTFVLLFNFQFSFSEKNFSNNFPKRIFYNFIRQSKHNANQKILKTKKSHSEKRDSLAFVKLVFKPTVSF